MKRILLAALLIAGPAHADLVASNGKNELRLLNDACTHAGILESLNPEYRAQFKRAVARLGAQTLSACWIDTNQGAYYVMFSDGDSLAVPVTAFIEVPGV